MSWKALLIFIIISNSSAWGDAGRGVAKGGGSVELRSVSFRYPARPEVQVFSQFSLRVEPGRSLALVGQSGSGKSTVISLVERFYDVEAGQVSCCLMPIHLQGFFECQLITKD